MTKNRERFVRLAESRVTRAIKDLRLIGNLANRSNYSYEKEDVEKMIGALEGELKTLGRRFENTDAQREMTFKL